MNQKSDPKVLIALDYADENKALILLNNWIRLCVD